MTEFEKRLISVVPSQRQVKWQETEFYAFIHYGINTFTNREWGTGQENPEIFNPRHLDTDQWCRCLVKAGMKGVILTAKHHDGFCLWDTKHTRHSVMSSPYGKDIVKQLSASCKKYGIKMGLYLSPRDRHEARYGQGKPYDDYFCAQLTELLENYGELFCVWFDGACGEGSNGKKQAYDWERYYGVIRRLQPAAAISVCGPDVRWCGNEAGFCRASEWSVVPRSMLDNEKIHENSQQEDDEAFRQKIPTGGEDLGSRGVLENAGPLAWYPAEVNTSIRPGWFYHEEEDDRVRSLEELSSIYIQSVGGNATFLLNIPPHPQGYIAPQDEKRLAELGDWLRESFRHNLLEKARFSASGQEEGKGPEQIGCPDGFWKAPDEAADSWISAEIPEPVAPRYIVLKEEIELSQRIEAFTLCFWEVGAWKTACTGNVVGYKRICPLPEGLKASKWLLKITGCRGGAALKAFELY